MNALYAASRDELLQALRDHGVTKDNVSNKTCLYVENDIIKATQNRDSANPDIVDGFPLIEVIGFWLWVDGKQYSEAYDSADYIFDQIDRGFEVNLQALKDLL